MTSLNNTNTSPAIVTSAKGMRAIAAAKGINAAEKAVGITVEVSLAALNVREGDAIELLIDGRNFAKPVIHTLTAAEIASGTAALVIAGNAGWGDDGNKTLSARLKDTTGHTSAIDSMTVTLDTSAPTVNNTLTIAAAAGGIDAAEKAAGVKVTAYLPAGTAAGDTIELLIDGVGFAKPVTHVITGADIAAYKVSLTIAGNDSAWGADGSKVISAHIIDIAGNIGIAGGERKVKLNTNAASIPETALTVGVAANGINAAEKAAGVAVNMKLDGSKAVAGDTIELLINGRSFAKPVTHVLTSAEVQAGSATLTINANAGWGDDGSKTLSARIKNATGIISALGGSTSVTLDTSAPAVENSLTIAAAAGGINAAEKAAGVAVVTYLPGGTAAGDTVELLIDGASFATPLTHVLTAAEIGARKLTLTIPGSDSAWGADGSKVISARIIDIAGNAGKAGGSRTVRLDTDAPAVQANALSAVAAANGINAAEKAAGVNVVMDLTGTNAVAGNTVELLMNGSPFTTSVTHVLTAAEVTAHSVTLTIASAAGWGADGSKTLTARISDNAGNSGVAGGTLAVTLDATAPGAPSNAITAAAAANGINNAEKTAGVAFAVDLAGTSAVAGDTLELLLNGSAFTTPVTHVLTAAEITAGSAVLTASGTAGWGADGSKMITAHVTDMAGNIGAAGGSLTVTLDTTAPTVPTGVIVTPVGGTVVANTLNNTNTHLNAQATITAGQATGGSAILKIGGVAVATDNTILAGDTTVTFTTSDGTPTNAELQAAIAAGGEVTVTLVDAAGNASTSTAGNPTLTVHYSAADAPTAVTLTPVGGTVVANALNATNTHLTAQATITAGQASGGSAVLKIGGVIVATDNTILAGDSIVTFTTSDGTPTNAELQAAIAAGGVATVTLIDVNGNTSTGSVANPTLLVDYIAPDAPFNPVAVTAGDISAAEKTAGVAVGIDLSGTNAAAGDTVELLIGSALFTTPVTHVLTSGEAIAANVMLNIAGNDSAWGGDGNKTLSVRVTDAAGNIGTAGGDLVLKLDTVAPAAAVVNPVVYTDQDGDGFINADDTFVLTFSEATDETIAIGDLIVNNSHTLGTGATAVWNIDGTQLIVTLGTGADIASGDVISIVGIADIAGNTANVQFTV